MADNPDKNELHTRKTPRLKVWDYSLPYWYFVTICTHNHFDFFGKIEDSKVQLNQLGKQVFQCWQEIPSHY